MRPTTVNQRNLGGRLSRTNRRALLLLTLGICWSILLGSGQGRVSAADPDWAPKLEEAKAAFAAGDYEAAIRPLSAVIESGPAPEAHYLRGECLRKSWYLGRANEDLEAAIKLHPQHARAHFSRGLLHEYRGYWDRASADYDAALAADPNLALPYVTRGGIRWKCGQIKAATVDLNRGIKLCNEALLANPNDFVAYRSRALAWRTLRKFDLAAKDYSQMIRLRPDSVEAHVESGRTHAAKYEQAMHGAKTQGGSTAFDEAQQCKAASVADFDQAIKLATALIEKEPQGAQGYRLRTEAYDAKAFAWKQPGDFLAAVADLDTLTRLAPGCSTVYFRRGHLRGGAVECAGDDTAIPKHFENALADLTETLRLDPTFAAALCERGLVYLRAAQRQHGRELAERGVADLTAMLQLAPKEGRIYCARGGARFLAGDSEGALTDSNEAVRLCPEMAEAYLLRGGINDVLGNKDASFADLARGRELQERLR